MRTIQMPILAFALLVLSSGVSAKVGWVDSGKAVVCRTVIIGGEACELSWCQPLCLRDYGDSHGHCDAMGCICKLCPPPALHSLHPLKLNSKRTAS